VRFLIFLIFVFTSFIGFTQTKVTINGKVTDEKGAIIEGVSVYLVNTQLGNITNHEGTFSITNVPTGTYNITASLLGYTPQTLFNVYIKSKGNPSFSFVLKDSTQNLDEIVISNNNRILRSKETPLSTQSLSAVEIASIPGGNNDVVRVAQSFPGVSPSVGGFRNDLIIRGGAPNETVYYLDGMEVPHINHFSTQGSGGGPVGMLNVAFVNDVTLSSSSFGAQYDNPLSGVLQFTQREGNKQQYATNIRVSATDAALTTEGPLFKRDKEESKTSYLVSVRRSYLQALFKLIGLPIRPNYWDYQYKISHKIDDYNDIYVLGLGSIDDFTVERMDEFDEGAQAALEQAPFIEQNSNSIGLIWKNRFTSGNGFMQTTLSHNRLKNVFTRYQNPLERQGVLFRNDATESEIKLRNQTTYFVNDWKLMFGFNIQHASYKNVTTDNVGSNNFSSSIDFMKYGLFVNTTTSFFEDKLDFSAGIRVDNDSFLEKTNLFNTFSPRMSLSYNISGKFKANATWGIYYKLPPYTILGYQNQLGELANNKSKYTKSTHWVAGLQYDTSPSSSFSLEGFYKKYDDFPVSIADGVSLANKGADFEVFGSEAITTVGKGRSYGIEFQYQKKFVERFYSIFSYTFFKSEFTGLTDTYLPSVWDSRHLLSFVGAYKLNRNWEVSGRYRFAGKTPYVPIDVNQSLITYPQLVSDYSRLGTVNLNTFSQLDVRVDKKWDFTNWALNVFVEIQNVLAQTLPTQPEYGFNRNDNGDVILPQSLVQIQDENSTPIPSIGIVIDF